MISRAHIPSFLVIAMFVVACDTDKVGAPHTVSVPPNCIHSMTSDSTLCDVSLLRLLATPADFDGMRVMTEGYIHFEFEGDGLYFHKEDFEQGLTHNAVWISMAQGASPAECQDAYVRVEGTFRAGFAGHGGANSGQLVDVSRCVAMGQPRPR